VIPVYNGARTLVPLLDRLQTTLARVERPFEVIAVNDGSRDDSWDVLERESSRRPWLTGIDLSRNAGQHNALLCGIRAARHDVTVTIDDDLQHPPEEIPALLARLSDGHDVVYGSPERERHGFWRDAASRTIKRALSGIFGLSAVRDVSGFRAFRTELRDAFAQAGGPSVNLDVLLTWGTTKFGTVKVRHEARETGVSNYTFWTLTSHALGMLTGFAGGKRLARSAGRPGYAIRRAVGAHTQKLT
jgi:undecaprenyl-phosphate 4-deoxy-4-formamido-L-arabinose transferase